MLLFLLHRGRPPTRPQSRLHPTVGTFLFIAKGSTELKMSDPYLSNVFARCSPGERIPSDDYEVAPKTDLPICRWSISEVFSRITILLGGDNCDGATLADFLATTREELNAMSPEDRAERPLWEDTAAMHDWMRENLPAILKIMVDRKMIKIVL